jgi:PAS domain S-box-containing protein
MNNPAIAPNQSSQPSDEPLPQPSAELQQLSTQQIATLLASIRDGFFSLNQDWQFTFVNPRAEAVLNRPGGDLIGHVIWEEFPDLVGTVFYYEYQRAVAQQTPITFEEFYPPLDTWFEVRAYPFEAGLSVYFSDIGDRKRYEAERQQAEERMRASHTFLNNIINGTSDPIFVKDAQHQWLLVNDALCAFVGLPREALIGKSDYDVFPKAQADGFWDVDQQVLTTGIDHITEEKLTTADGTETHISTKKSSFTDAYGNRYVVGTIRDVTQLKQQEQQLKQMLWRFNIANQATHEGIWEITIVDGDVANPQNPIWWSPKFLEILGYANETEFPPDFNRWINSIHPDDVNRVLHGFEQHFSDATGDTPYDVEYRIQTQQGAYIWVRDVGKTIHNHAQVPVMIVGTICDVSDRKLAQDAVEQQQHMLKAILDTIPNRLWLKDRQGRHMAVNQSFSDALGLAPTDLIGKTDADLWSAAEAATFWQEDQRIMQLGQPETLEEELILPDERRWFSTTKTPMRNDQGQIVGTIGISTDITERRQAEERLRQAKDELEDRVKARTAELRATVSRLKREVSDRKTAENALRRSEQELRQQAVDLESTLHTLQKTQAQLIQSEKMSSLGQLVAGIAHEINNPVNFIYGNLTYSADYTKDLINLVQLYQQHYPQPIHAIQSKIHLIDLEFLLTDLPKLMSSMKLGAERIQSIVASLRSFSRMDEAECKRVDIHDGIQSTLMILQSRLKATLNRPAIVVETEFGTLPLVECYAGQLNQVFMNIISNAIDALDNKLATLTVRPHPLASSNLDSSALDHPDSSDSALVTPFVPTIRIHTTHADPDHVQVTIADNGPGMSTLVQQRLFDPFYTTKPVGKGTGLGLSVSYQIICETHGGSLRCVSVPGSGAELHIEIPIHQSEAT